MTAGPGSIRIDSRMDISKSVPRGSKREKQWAAGKDTSTAVTTELRDMTTEFGNGRRNEVLPSFRSRKSFSVGLKISVGGVARVSLRVSKADRMIQPTGAKDTEVIAIEIGEKMTAWAGDQPGRSVVAQAWAREKWPSLITVGGVRRSALPLVKAENTLPCVNTSTISPMP